MKPTDRMRRTIAAPSAAIFLAAAIALLFAATHRGPQAIAKDDPGGLVVHEWGTFLSMSGSDGTVLDGMYHEEHALPAFVHARSRDQLRLQAVQLKGETPVIYFYTEARQRVRLAVDFPRGIWTQWYPQAAAVKPALTKESVQPERLEGGRICWHAEVLPATTVTSDSGQRGAARQPSEVVLPATSSDALWNFARDVDAAYVKVLDLTKNPAPAELERFLFYRGLGQSRLPLGFTTREGGTLGLDHDPTLGRGISHVFVIRVENGRGAYRYHAALAQGEQKAGVIPSRDQLRPLVDFTEEIGAALTAKLTSAGLYPKEARAMVNTWTNSYFQTDGIRVLFVLPQSWTDAFIPMTVDPTPRSIVRVMVGRVELLTPERERAVENGVCDLADRDPVKRAQAFRILREQGRYLEPIVRRLMKTTTDDGVRSLCSRLLLTEFATALRAAVCNADDGRRINVQPQLLRAHLARTLREVGLDDQARAEGDAVLEKLGPDPRGGQKLAIETPTQIEARAAALEAVGDDRRAAATYALRIELESRTLPAELNEASIAWLRDWWIGRAYARCLARAGAVDAAINDCEQVLSRRLAAAGFGPEVRASTLLVAYLREGQGKSELALPHWSHLSARPVLGSSATPSQPGPEAAGRTGT